MKTTATLSLATILCLTGCASFSTIPITRHDNNAITGDSNGHQRWFSRTRPYKGVPVKLKVQTHLDVFIKEKYALCLVGGSKVNQWHEKQLGSTEESPIRLLYVEATKVMGEQVVITDFKRPASGTVDLTLDFNDDQYFKKIDSTITDNTITDSAALLTTILSGTGIISAKSFADQTDTIDTPEIKWQERTIAYQRFDINSPDFEQQVEEFANHHLNNCNNCSKFGSPAFPHTEAGHIVP